MVSNDVIMFWQLFFIGDWYHIQMKQMKLQNACCSETYSNTNDHVKRIAYMLGPIRPADPMAMY